MVRKIFVEKLEEIDFDNFGVHFSRDNNYKHSGGGSNGLTPSKARFQVSAWVRRAKINERATEISNENHPQEKEAVLEFSQVLTAEIGVWDLVENKFVSFEKRKINTGRRADKWVLEI